MASSFQKLTAEQVRARYRQSFPRADLLKPTIVDAMDDTGLIHSSKLDFALNVTIPEWSERPPFPGPVNVLRMEWLLPSSNQWRDFGDPEDIPGPIEAPDLDFPLERSIPVDVFRDHEGPFEFRYRVKNWNNATERVSATAPVLLDRSGPVWVNPLTAMIDIVEKPVITDAVLARDLGVYCIIPDFVEANRVDVWVKVYWMTRPPLPTENIADFQVLSIQLPPDRKVLIPEDVIKGYGSKTQFAVAVLFDKAGNPGERSLPATVPVALGTLPSGLQPCTVPLAEDAETLIDRADAAYPTEVHIKEYTGWHDSHGVQIWWGGHKLPITSVGAHSKWPLKIPVPWSIMSLVYDFDSTTHVQDIDVDYQILVGDYPFDSPGPVNINTDFAIPKPGDPDPDPIDISLNLIEFLSFSGSSTELTLSDIDEDATVFIELYDDPEIGVTFTGGRKQTYTFKPGQTQPETVTTPSGQVIGYEYQTKLGTEPVRRRLPRVGVQGEYDEAEYEYDEKNARLLFCQEQGLQLTREYFSTGELKSEKREGPGGTYTMSYRYSRLGRLLGYTDVLGQEQSYDYDLQGRLIKTQLGTTTSTFGYDSLGQTETINTSDSLSGQSVGITLQYDEFGRETLRSFDLNGVKQTLSQVYNDVDGLTQRILMEGAVVLRDEIYGYDLRGRLTNYDCTGTQPPVDPYGKAIQKQVFTFDPLDNITLVMTYFDNTFNRARYFYDNLDKVQLSKVTNTHAAYPSVINLLYNLDGHLIKDEEQRTLDYDALGRLISVSVPSGGASKSTSYTYTPLDNIASNDDGSGQAQRFYQGDQLANQVKGADSRTFMWGDNTALAELQAGDVLPKS